MIVIKVNAIDLMLINIFIFSLVKCFLFHFAQVCFYKTPIDVNIFALISVQNMQNEKSIKNEHKVKNLSFILNLD